jgi:hypothetical protein
MVKTDEDELKDHLHSYLSHHAVVRMDSETTPVRVVINGNTKESGGFSSNDWLSSSLNVLPLIHKIIFNARMNPVFIVADISKAFMQVVLALEDQWLLVIQWPRCTDGAWQVETYRFKHMPWGIACAPAMLNTGLRYLYQKIAREKPELKPIMKVLEDNSYVDDLMMGGKNNESTYEIADTAFASLEQVSMKLTKIKSYPPELSEKYGVPATRTPYKILGIGFDPATDTISVRMDRIDEFSQIRRLTKRQSWGLVARFHDPIGIASGCLLIAKLYRRQLDVKYPKAKWDHTYTKVETKRWHEIVAELCTLKEYKLPRLITQINEIKVEYHIFTDASGDAIGTAIYRLSKGEDGKSISTLVMSKTKLIPLPPTAKRKEDSSQQVDKIKPEFHNLGKTPFRVNRMELNGALLGVKLFASLSDQIEIDAEIHCWVDNQNVIRWILGGPLTGVSYVDRRITEIQITLKGAHWHYVPGEQNPADMCTRPQSASYLSQSKLWSNGPEWLATPTNWPEQPFETTQYSVKTTALREFTEEDPLSIFIRPDDVKLRICVVRFAFSLRMKKIASETIQRTRIRKQKNLRTEIPLRKEGGITKRKYRKGQDQIPKINYREYVNAQLDLIRFMQQAYEKKLYKTLSENPDIIVDGLVWSNKYQLIMSRGRQPASNPKLSRDQVPSRDLIHIPYSRGQYGKDRNPLAELIMIDSHTRCGHGAARSTLTEFRTKYWIKKGIKLAMWSKKLCPYCKRLDAQTVVAPEAPLPLFRCIKRPPFQAVGIDFLGPLHQINETGEPSYIVVFSCTYTRALILRPMTTVSAPAFAAVFNSVRYDYGIEPLDIVSDRALTFKCVFTRTLKEKIKFLEQEFPQIKWHFNAARAPWWGGFFERMMHVIKDKLARCFIRRHDIFANFYRFQEAVSYVQCVINSRPLTWMSADENEERHAICPITFLNFYSRHNVHPTNPYSYGPADIDYVGASAKELQEIVKAKELAYNEIWDSFYDSYVAELRNHTAKFKVSTDHLLKVGLIVIFRPVGWRITNKAGEKRKWKLAKIVKLHPGRDGHVRSIDLEIYDERSKETKILESQSIRNIAILEADLTADSVEVEKEKIVKITTLIE